MSTSNVSSLTAYRASPSEQMREQSLLAMLGSGTTVLDIGARDGHFSRLLQQRFHHVTALDLQRPEVPGCECVAGDVREMKFADREFSAVLCAEVLEHVPGVEKAAREIARVAQDKIVIGVPYKQDTRRGRVRCQACGKVSPPWGHINTFDEQRLRELFAGWQVRFDYICESHEWATTGVAAWLMDRAGNPFGTYSQQEPCECGATYVAPRRNLASKVMGKIAVTMDRVTDRVRGSKPNWIHAIFTRA